MSYANHFMKTQLLLSLFISVTVQGAPIPETVEFNRDVRSIISDRCFKCHGPDEATQEARCPRSKALHQFHLGFIFPNRRFAESKNLLGKFRIDQEFRELPGDAS